MKKASVALLVSLMVPAFAWVSSRVSPTKHPVLHRTNDVFDSTDKNNDGVLSRHEFMGSHRPSAAPGPAPVTMFAPMPMPAAPKEQTAAAPKGLDANVTNATNATATVNTADEVVLAWPADVEPGTEDTVTNVTLNSNKTKIVGVWHTQNVSAWEGDTSEMPDIGGDTREEAAKKVKKAVDKAMELPPKKPPAPPIDGATSAAKDAVQHHGARGDTVSAAAVGGSGAKLRAVTLTVELQNVNYHMLDEPVIRSPAVVPAVIHFLQSAGPIDAHPPHLEESHVATNGELIQSAVKDTLDQLLAIALGQVSGLEEDELPHVHEAHVNLGHAVLVLSQHGKSPAPAPVAGLPWAPAASVPGVKDRHPPGLDDAVDVEEPRHRALPRIGVTFLPGRPCKTVGTTTAASSQLRFAVRAGQHSSGRASRVGALLNRGHHVECVTTLVQVDLVEHADEYRVDIDEVRKILSMYILDGTLSSAIAAAITEKVDMTPKIGIIEEATGSVSPYNVSACASHIHKLVGDFSRAYSRRQVIPALYHACTHYGQKLSFSHDPIIDHHDKTKCREATTRFSRLWQFGKGRVDYGRFCLQLCELRFGGDSIQCDAYKHFSR